MNLPLFLALHWMTFFPDILLQFRRSFLDEKQKVFKEKQRKRSCPLKKHLWDNHNLDERTWSSLKEAQVGSYSWYHSLQVAGERFEEHIKTITLLLQKFDQSMKEQVGALDKLASNRIKNLGEWLEEHTRDLNVWLNMYFWALQEFHNRYMKHPDYMLAREIVLRDKCWNEDITREDPWLEYSNTTLYSWLEEAPLIVYKALRMQGSNLKTYTEIQIQHIEDHVRFLEQLLDNYSAAASKSLEDYATVKETSSQNFTWDFFTVVSKAEMLGSLLVKALQGNCLMVMKWLEENVEGMEQLLWNIVNW